MLGNEIVGRLGQQDTRNDRELVHRHQTAADGGRGNLGDVNGRQVGRQPDGHAAGHAPEVERGETGGQARADRRDAKDHCGEDQEPFTAELVAQPPATMAPIRQPTSALLIAQAVAEGVERRKNRS